ncbi:GNAT family N-acetyltransferase [Marinobacterium jannaschii]|uniref:GNAT family N-acetyltransferase n=1 Tax=Marinobacterium jannaschii TaxID=64970 RepID=UPI000485229D|nr:GNAT family N-acetyltransferase [Marinobacterium jannaschii]
MNKHNYQIRAMTCQELDIAIDWAAAEGWNPGLHDADSYYRADPNGFFIGLLDDEPIACISTVRYDDQFGFLGFYIVKPEFRGQGYGMAIWNTGLDYLDGCNIGLDGVLAQQDNYRQSGFKLAYSNIRFEGQGGGDAIDNAAIVTLSELPFSDLDRYDQPFFPTGRSDFTRHWIGQSDGTALGILQDGKLAGYGVIRPCRSGYKIGPLFADSAEQAEALFLALRAKAGAADPVYLDVPEVNSAAVDLAGRYGMQRVFETARMYTGEQPELPLDRTYGVTSFEIG